MHSNNVIYLNLYNIYRGLRYYYRDVYIGTPTRTLSYEDFFPEFTDVSTRKMQCNKIDRFSSSRTHTANTHLFAVDTLYVCVGKYTYAYMLPVCAQHICTGRYSWYLYHILQTASVYNIYRYITMIITCVRRILPFRY